MTQTATFTFSCKTLNPKPLNPKPLNPKPVWSYHVPRRLGFPATLPELNGSAQGPPEFTNRRSHVYTHAYMYTNVATYIRTHGYVQACHDSFRLQITETLWLRSASGRPRGAPLCSFPRSSASCSGLGKVGVEFSVLWMNLKTETLNPKSPDKKKEKQYTPKTLNPRNSGLDVRQQAVWAFGVRLKSDYSLVQLFIVHYSLWCDITACYSLACHLYIHSSL